MLSFLGMSEYSQQWICDFTHTVAALIKIFAEDGKTNLKGDLKWTDEAE